jgi:hypothetical protein
MTLIVRTCGHLCFADRSGSGGPARGGAPSGHNRPSPSNIQQDSTSPPGAPGPTTGLIRSPLRTA